uniref:Peptidase C1A papain C-terminal domain-containing protein n=1 Tax=Panagrolaimus sp. ES5 TaxID=591445 RepID=A0AC34FC17_9BILA
MADINDADIQKFSTLATQAKISINNGEELAQRILNYEKAKEDIKNLEGKHSGATFKINKFALMSEAEQQKFFATEPKNEDKNLHKRSAFDNTVSTSIPTSFDYRSYGKVTPAKDQLGDICGSCWAHAAVGAIESQYLIRYNLSLDLSEQYIVSCEKLWHKCLGGYERDVYRFAMENGIPTEACYPYTATNGTCSSKCDNQYKYRVTSYKWEGYDESKFAAALYNNGPLTMGFMTSKAYFYYSSGILDMPMSECNAGNHAMLLVGYTKDYWIAKNSFGPEWGENGFIRFKRGVNWCDMTRGIFSVYVAPTVTPPPTNSPTAPPSLDPSTLDCPNYDGGILKMNSTWRNVVLKEFNNQRSQIANGKIISSAGVAFPKAKNMRKLIYNCSLEAEIQKAVESCTLNAQTKWKWFGVWLGNEFLWSIS